MRPELKEAFFKQQIRREIRKVVKKHTLNEEATLYSTFVQPFTDVLQAVNLATQDILSAHVMMIKILWHIDPEKVNKAIADHDARSAEIAKKWEPLMARIDENLSSGDADFLALMFAPGFFAATELGTRAYDAAEGMGEFMSNSGLKVPLIGSLFPGGAAGEPIGEPEGTKKGMVLLDKLELLFLGAAGIGAVQASRRKEAKKESKLHKPLRSRILTEAAANKVFVKDFDQYLEDVGAQDELDKSKDELVENLKDTVTTLDKEFESRKTVIDNLVAATDFDQFVQALDATQTQSAELESPKIAEVRKTSKRLVSEAIEGIETMKKELEDGVDKLAKSEDFVEQVKEETGKSEVTDEEIKKAAKKVMFLDSKKSLEEKIQVGLEDLKKLVADGLSKVLPTKKGVDVLKTTSDGIKIANFIEKTKQKYGID